MNNLTEEKNDSILSHKPKTIWSESWKRLKKDRLALLGGSIIIIMLIIASLSKYISPYDPNYQFNNGTTSYGMPFPPNTYSKKIVAKRTSTETEFTIKASTLFKSDKFIFRTVGNTKVKKGVSEISFEVSPLNLKHINAPAGINVTTDDKIKNNFEIMTLENDKYFLLGTDSSGRDSLSRLIWGAQVSLQVGILAIGLATIIGVVLGLISGYFGKWVDLVIMRLTDIMMSMPDLLLVMALVSVLPSKEDKSSQGIGIIIFSIGIVSWTGIARMIRSQVLTVKEMEFIEASKASGSNNFVILFKHLLPNVIAPIIVISTMSIASAIMTEAALSFLGFGVKSPTASWGSMVNEGIGFFRDAPWVPIIPGIAIAISVFSFNLFGDGIRDALDPKLKQ
jgi:ABC-type dipeptide/oligopeptide/nickel transport system permease subunit